MWRHREKGYTDGCMGYVSGVQVAVHGEKTNGFLETDTSWQAQQQPGADGGNCTPESMALDENNSCIQMQKCPHQKIVNECSRF